MSACISDSTIMIAIDAIIDFQAETAKYGYPSWGKDRIETALDELSAGLSGITIEEAKTQRLMSDRQIEDRMSKAHQKQIGPFLQKRKQSAKL